MALRRFIGASHDPRAALTETVSNDSSDGPDGRMKTVGHHASTEGR
jgi:hypothetical protein